jgi:hypothetical protein
MAGENKCVYDVGRITDYACSSRCSRIYGETPAAAQAQVGRFDPDTKFSFRLRVVSEPLVSMVIDVVGIALVPRVDRIPAVLAYESNAFGHGPPLVCAVRVRESFWQPLDLYPNRQLYRNRS